MVVDSGGERVVAVQVGRGVDGEVEEKKAAEIELIDIPGVGVVGHSEPRGDEKDDGPLAS